MLPAKNPCETNMKYHQKRFWVCLLFCYAFLYTPLFAVLVASFSSSENFMGSFSFSFHWYEKLWGNTDLWMALLNSLKVAFLNAVLAVFVGVICAFYLVRMRNSLFVRILSSIPFVVPEVVLGLAFLIFFVTVESWAEKGSIRGMSATVIGHTTLSLSYVVLLLKARFLEIDESLEEAALDLGAKPLGVFLWITLPSIASTLFSSWVLAFTLSLDDLVIASFTSGVSSCTLPIFVFSELKTGLTPEMCALGSVVMACVLIVTPVIGRVIKRT